MASDPNQQRIDIFQLMEDRRVEHQAQYELLHERISNMKDEIYAEISNSHHKIMSEIKELRKEQNEHALEMSSRIAALEKWKWTIVGGALVIGFVLSGGVYAFSKIFN